MQNDLSILEDAPMITNNKQQTTNNKQQTTNNKQQTTNNKVLINPDTQNQINFSQISYQNIPPTYVNYNSLPTHRLHKSRNSYTHHNVSMRDAK